MGGEGEEWLVWVRLGLRKDRSGWKRLMAVSWSRVKRGKRDLAHHPKPDASRAGARNVIRNHKNYPGFPSFFRYSGLQLLPRFQTPLCPVPGASPYQPNTALPTSLHWKRKLPLPPRRRIHFLLIYQPPLPGRQFLIPPMRLSHLRMHTCIQY